jgi:dTDP-4-amino-4,6-dideoxygalactose transaminase
MPVVNEQGEVVDLVQRRDLTSRVWLSSPHLGEEETAFVAEAFASNWVAPLGPHVDGFERELAERTGLAQGAALSSGTAALHLGLLLLGVKPGDTVICSSLTFIGSCNPIAQCGATPIFVDSEPESWNMSPRALERALAWCSAQGQLPKCAMIVNLYGQSADMDALLPICERYGVPVLEDAAESLGATYKGKPSGSFGKLSVFSFNGNKIITTSGGGMLLGQDAREPARHYEHVEPGFNYRMSNVLAGIGRGQLKVLSDRVAQRRAVFDRYVQALADLPFVHWMPEPAWSVGTRWLSCFYFALQQPREGAAWVDDVLTLLERHNVEARPVWKPMHLQPLYRGARYFAHGDDHDVDFPRGDVCGQLFRAGICLPSGSNMSTSQQDRVIALLRQAVAACTKRQPAALAE